MTKPGVLAILPSWGGGKGGLHLTAQSMMQQLVEDERPVYCLLSTDADLILAEEEHIQQMNIVILQSESLGEEETSHELACFKHVLPILKLCNHIVTFASSTTDIADYLLCTKEASGCELVIVQHDEVRSEEDIVKLAKCVHSAKAVLPVGNRLSSFLHKNVQTLMDNFMLIPDYAELKTLGKRQTTPHQPPGRILVPLTGTDDKLIAASCLCAVNILSGSQSSEHKTLVTQIQVKSRSDPYDFYFCNSYGHVHSQFQCDVFASMQEVEQAAKQCAVIVASGQFTETGFSGLEFMVKEYITLVPEGTDVAQILQEVSPGFAPSFILPRMNSHFSEKERKSILEKWGKQIAETIQDADLLLSRMNDVMQRLQSWAPFTNSKQQLRDIFCGKLIKVFYYVTL